MMRGGDQERASQPGSLQPPERPARPRSGPGRKEPPAQGRSPRVPYGAGGHELLYGRHAVLETLRANRRRIYRVLIAAGVQPGGTIDQIVRAARERGVPVLEVPREQLEREVPANHQGVAAETGPYPYIELDELLDSDGGEGLYLLLDHLQDVQNLGTLLRTAEAMAVSGVLLPDRRAAGVTPAVVNASAGAVEHLRIAVVVNLVQAIDTMKEAGAWVAGLDDGADAVPLSRADLTGPLALVVGAEGPGLSRLVRERCDWLVSIPMYGRIESLNASVAGSIVLAAARQAREAAFFAPANEPRL